MTTLGHILAGTAVGIVVMPGHLSMGKRLLHLGIFTLLPNIPDLPLPYWGHDRYEISHSIFINALLCSFVAACLLKYNKTTPQLIVAGTIAWLSHLLLDSFYGDGLGVPILWPFSDFRAHLPLPWFAVITTGMAFSAEVKKQFTAELFTYFPLIILACAYRYFAKSRSPRERH